MPPDNPVTKRNYMREYSNRRRRTDPVFAERKRELSRALYQRNKKLIQKRASESRRARLEVFDKRLVAQGLIYGARKRARMHGVAMSLRISDISVPDFCPVLGIPLRPCKGHPSANSPSLDRIVPKDGYVPENVIVVSHFANAIKNNATPQQLKAVADFYLKLEAEALTLPTLSLKG